MSPAKPSVKPTAKAVAKPAAKAAAKPAGKAADVPVAKADAKPVRKPSARRRSREFVLQALYQWQLTGQAIRDIERQFSEADGFAKADGGFFSVLLQESVGQAAATQAAVEPHLDRPWIELSPIERGILLLSGREMLAAPDVPYRVIINEAIELAKSYGGTDGHKYVNGVLDKLAGVVRADEIAYAAKQPRPARRA